MHSSKIVKAETFEKEKARIAAEASERDDAFRKEFYNEGDLWDQAELSAQKANNLKAKSQLIANPNKTRFKGFFEVSNSQGHPIRYVAMTIATPAGHRDRDSHELEEYQHCRQFDSNMKMQKF